MGARLPLIITNWFHYSSRKDQLAAFVHARLEEDHWYSRLEQGDISPDEEILGLLDLLMAMISPEEKVQYCLPFVFLNFTDLRPFIIQREKLNSASQEVITRLITLCDSILLKYLSKLADTPAKRNHLCAAYTAVGQYELTNHDLDTIIKELPSILDLRATDFPLACEDLRKLFALIQPPKNMIPEYLENLLSDPGRSGVLHYDPAQWNTIVGIRYLRNFRTSWHVR